MVLTSTHNLYFGAKNKNQRTNGPVNAHLRSDIRVSIENLLIYIYQYLFDYNMLKRSCYSSIMDIPPVHNQPQRSFGKANPVNRSFQASWFSTRTWLHYYETYKISSSSRAKIVTKCIKIVSTDVRKYKILSGEIP